MEVVSSAVKVRPPTSSNRQLIAQAVQDNVDKLFRTLCVYVRKAGLGTGAEIPKIATECLSEVVERALRNAERFEPGRQPVAWLLGIASNVILQEKHKRIRQRTREPFLQDLVKASEQREAISTEQLIARLAPALETSAATDEQLASKQHYLDLLSHVSEAEQTLLHLSIVQQYTAKEIAQELGSTPGAIRVRLFRALKRLRGALEKKNHELTT